MTSEEKISPSAKQPFIVAPWLVAAGALLLYGLTLNHWVTLSNLPVVAKVTGWDWHPLPLAWRPNPVAPLFFILTCPIRVLPAAWQPAALNAFAAICAALTLGLLAASVRLLPHDRTREQRQREGGEFALLSMPGAFLPPLLAVLVLALQLTFWRNAVCATGDMLDVLVFAFLILCLLKYRITQSDKWLMAFAFVYGLGTTNNWALVGFFPLFFIALVWIKGINFFNWGFIARMIGCGVAGLSLYCLIPAMASLGPDRGNFLSILHLELGMQSFGLRSIPRWIAAVAALPTLLPLFFAGINWPSFEGEISAAGNALTKLMFRLLHVFFLVVALALFFDFKRSPSVPLKEAPVGFLTFYYLGALCVGYFSGYVLLVYGKSPIQGWDRSGSLTKAFNTAVVGLLLVAAAAAPCRLFYDNISHINAERNNALADYSKVMIDELPAKSAVVLSDDAAQLYLLQAALQKEGKANDDILIDTGSLPQRGYLAHLLSRYPELKKLTITPETMPRVIPGEVLVRYLYGLSRKYPIYYLHPSFGYYFEVFYLKPHGLVYEMQPYPKDAVQAPLPTSREIQDNQAIWATLEKTSLAELPVRAKLSPDIASVSGLYSVDLDFWSTMLQKAGHLREAEAQFDEALRLNPQNFIALINRQYNEQLQKNNPRPIESGDLVFKATMLYRGPVPILKMNGPPDEPGLNLDFGKIMAEGHNYRQAAALFERRLELLPGDAEAELAMAKTFVDWGHPDKALDYVRKLRANPTVDKWEVTRVEALAYFTGNNFSEAERLMRAALKEAPQDENRITILAEFYRATAYSALHEKKAIEAGRRFTNALAYFNEEIQLLTQSGHNPSGQNTVSDILLKKAEVETMLKQFDASIATLNQLLALEPANATALLNRAIAQIQLTHYDAAKADYKALRKLMPRQPYVVDYGLAEIGAKEGNVADEIRYLKRYLDSAPDDTAEYQHIKQRLKKLESR